MNTAQYSASPQSGRITHGPTTTLVERTLEFIRSRLPLWRDDPDRAPQAGENKLNVQLCDYLDRSARFHFPLVRFSREEPQTGRSTIDLAAKPVVKATIRGREYTIYHAFLVIEGKRLPAPTSDREREYVSGGRQRTGGIQRFKLGAHGAEVDVAAMVGYVQKGAIRDWHAHVNGWILDLVEIESGDACTWNADEILHVVDYDQLQRTMTCRSLHGRSGATSGDAVTLFHFWVAMT